MTQEQAAEVAQVSVRTVGRRQRAPAFVALVQRLRGAILNDAYHVICDAVPQAAATFIELMGTQQPPRVRLGAAEAVYRQMFRLHDAVVVEQRMRLLENALSLDDTQRA
jgi:hypothetical protein